MLQNLDIAAGAGRGAWTVLRRRHGSCRRRSSRALETVGLTARRDALAGALAHGHKQWLEIGMLLVQNVDLLLLDEPVAGMSHEEREGDWRAARVDQRRTHCRGHRARHGLHAQLRPDGAPCCTRARC